MGGQFQCGNTANWRHGGRSTRSGLVLPGLGAKYAHIYNCLKNYRHALEGMTANVLKTDARRVAREISAAVGFERTRLLACRLIAAAPDAKPGDVLEWSKTANWAERERNAAEKRLGLQAEGAAVSAATAIADLYAGPRQAQPGDDRSEDDDTDDPENP
jgi:hypothetical protein